ncbi:MAG: hypothetical protein ABQ298_01100 [Puniceicoccaceae bacterium]
MFSQNLFNNRVIRRFSAFFSLFLLPVMWGNWGVLNAQSQPNTRLNLDLQKVRSMFEAVQSTLDGMDTTIFDVEAYASSLPDNPVEIALSIQALTDWEPYSGLLKGAEGTLISKAGNSLDRALLLMYVLRYKGYQANLAYQDAIDGETQSLLKEALTAELRSAKPDIPLFDAEANLKRVMEAGAKEQQAFEEFATQVEAMSVYYDELNQLADESADQLKTIIGNEMNAVAPSLMDDSTAVHFWVQYTDGQTEKDVCVVFGDTLPQALLAENPNLCKSAADLPQEWIHQVTFRVALEQSKEAVLKTVSVLDHTLPVYQVTNRKIDFRFNPTDGEDMSALMQMPESVEAGTDLLKSVIESPEGWIPSLKIAGNDETIYLNGFDRTGETFDPEDGNQSPTGKKLNDATSLLGQLSFGGAATASDPSIIRSLWYEIEISAPGKAVTVERRALFDNPELKPTEDPSSAISKQLAYALTRSAEFLVQSGTVSGEYVLYKQLDSMMQLKLPMEYAVATYQRNPEEFSPEILQKIAEKVPEFSATLYAYLAQRSQNLVRVGGMLSHANVISFVTDFREQPESVAKYAGFDVITNRVEMLPDVDDHVARQLEAGVFDTCLEYALMRQLAKEESSEQFGAISSFRKAMEQGSDWEYVSSVDQLEQVAESLSAETRQALKEHLDAGYSLVLNPIQTDEVASWWRVDPDSGETLGMAYGPVGLGGSEFMQYLLLIKFVGGTLINVFSLGKCLLAAEAAGKSGVGCTICAIFTQAAIFLSLAIGVGSEGLTGAAAISAAKAAGLADLAGLGVAGGCLLT